MYGRGEIPTKLWSENMNAKDFLDKLGVDGNKSKPTGYDDVDSVSSA
jgi:hypothetical protein